MARALVTGGAGFIGSALVDRLLAEGWAVDVVDDLSTGSLANLGEARADQSHDFTFHRLDIRSDALLDLMTRRRPDLVYHLAASTDAAASVTRPVADADVNILGSLNVLEGARAAGTTKVVFASTAGSAMPVSPGAVAKRAVEEYLSLYRELHAIEFTALALASVYGPRQESGVALDMARRLLRGEAAVVHGDGSDAADFVFVDDAVDAFARAADRGGGLVLNVGTGAVTTVGELHAAMATALGVDATAVFVAGDSGLGEGGPVDPARTAIHLGWRPWTALGEGVAALLRSLA
jgi:UDP-glucose 4-epimerase